jgi:hypothetical protein
MTQTMFGGEVNDVLAIITINSITPSRKPPLALNVLMNQHQIVV